MRRRIRVTFTEGVVLGEVAPALTTAGEQMYVLVLDDGRRMLVSAVPAAEFEVGLLEDLGLFKHELLINPCGADSIEECGLNPAEFDTHYEGGLFSCGPEPVAPRRIQ